MGRSSNHQWGFTFYEIAFIFLAAVAIVAFVLSIIAFLRGTQANNAITRATTIIKEPSEMVVFFNPAAGYDVLNGDSVSNAVRTFDRVLQLFEQITADNCTIVVLADWVIASDSMLCFFPIVRQCKHIYIAGVEQNVHLDTVVNITTVAENSYQWKELIMQTGGITTNAYTGYFVENVNQRRTYVVNNNTDTSFISISSDTIASLPLPPVPPAEVFYVPWTVGDQLRLFKVATKIQWSGELFIDVPYNKITFNALHFAPTAAESYLRVPDGADYKVILQGCLLDCYSTYASFRGTLSLRGCYASGLIANAMFIQSTVNHNVLAESLWVNAASSYYSGLTALYSFKSTHAPMYALTTAVSVCLITSVLIEEPVDAAIIITDGSISRIDNCQITKTDGNIVNSVVLIDAGSDVLMSVTIITCDNTFCQTLITVGTGAFLRIFGEFETSDAVFVNVLSGGTFHVLGETLSVTVTTIITPFIFEPGSSAYMFPTTAFIINVTVPGEPIIRCIGCSLLLQGSRTVYQWATQVNTPLIEVTQGGSALDDTSGGGMSAQGNFGPTPTAVIKCGSLAIATWAATQFDTVQNTMCTT